MANLGSSTTDLTASSATAADATIDEINKKLVVKSTESLNGAVDNRATGDTLVKVPAGTTTYDEESWSYDGGSLVIQGQGINMTTLQADGVERFWRTSTDQSGQYIELRDLTVDMNNVTSKGRLFQMVDNLGGLQFHNVEIKNMDLANIGTDSREGLVQITSGVNMDYFIVSGRSEIRLDTATNFGTDSGEVYAVLDADRGSSVIDTVVVDDKVRTIGTLHAFHNGTENLFQGYRAQFADHMRISGNFENWDQYAMWANAQNETAICIYDGAISQAGDGDQVRATPFNDTGQYYLAGSISYEEDPTSPDLEHDRGYIVQGGSADLVHLDGTVVNGHVCLEVRGSRLVTGDITCYNPGDPDSGESQRAIQFNHHDAVMGKIDLGVRIFNESTVKALDPAIELEDVGNNSWRSGTVILKGLIEGYETTMLSDGTPSGVTVDTSDLIDDGSI